MSQIDDKINSLSNEELDLLNSDPKLLADFKAKYSAPIPHPDLTEALREGMTEGVKTALPSPEYNQPLSPTSDNPVMGGAQAALQTLRDPTRISPTMSQPGEVAGNAVEDNVGGTTGKVAGFATKVLLDPNTWSGMGLGENALKTGVEGSANFMEELGTNAESKMADLNNKLARIPVRATQLKGYNEPVPTTEELDTATKKVIQAFKDVKDEHGAILDKAKQSVGLPATAEEKSASIRKYGNTRNLDLNKPLELPSNLTKKAPIMEEALSGATTKDVVGTGDVEAYVKGVQKGLPDKGIPDIKIYGVKGDPEKIKALFGSADVASVPESVLKEKGVALPGLELPPMPYKISPTKTAEELNTEVNRFLKNQDFISDTDKVKAASYYQDKINKYVDWGTEQTDIEGMLKSQHTDLKNVIKEASPELQKAKTGWKGMLDSLDLVRRKLNPKTPGETQAYLKKLFTSTSPAVQDHLKQLAYLEKASGKPIITELFKKFAGQSFADWASRPGREILEATAGLGSLALGHPAGAVGAGAVLAAQSPKVLGVAERFGSKLPALASKYGPAAAYTAAKSGFTPAQIDPSNGSQLQSVRDRLNNGD